MSAEPAFRIAALYCFTPIDDVPTLRDELAAEAERQNLCGTLLIAAEGINGTIAGAPHAVDLMIAALSARPEFAGLDVKYSASHAKPFGRMKVRIKREIVTMGIAGIDPRTTVGTYVDAHDWNALIADPATLVIDTRNAYEVAIGSFAGAIDPGTARFGDFPAWFRAHRDELLAGKTRVAMFCTGGIRCEKSTAFLKAEGVEDVFHLKGGILRYLEDVEPADSLWHGECFVFDERVAVGHGLVPGTGWSRAADGRPVRDDGE
jgi:UPF0176 protein